MVQILTLHTQILTFVIVVIILYCWHFDEYKFYEHKIVMNILVNIKLMNIKAYRQYIYLPLKAYVFIDLFFFSSSSFLLNCCMASSARCQGREPWIKYFLCIQQSSDGDRQFCEGVISAVIELYAIFSDYIPWKDRR